ncbi:MAG: hypothetical protein AB7T32_11120 [Dehalococcoidia bacterium]
MSPQSPAHHVIERTKEVVAYQHNPGLEGRPIGVMFAGGVLAIVAAVLCARLVYSIWYLESIDLDQGIYGVSFLFALYVLGAHCFALGYELYDGQRAVRLTIVFALFGLIGLVFMIGVLIALVAIQTGAGIVVTEGQKTKALSTVASFSGGFEDADEDTRKRAAEIPGFPMVTCGHCDRDFFAVPPDAMCPWCDTPYLTMDYGATTARRTG